MGSTNHLETEYDLKGLSMNFFQLHYLFFQLLLLCKYLFLMVQILPSERSSIQVFPWKGTSLRLIIKQSINSFSGAVGIWKKLRNYPTN